MRYGQIRQYDIANGPGIRTSIFVTGCSLKCKNCFNKDYQDPNYGNLWTEENTLQIVNYLKKDEISGLTILGGEPFENAIDLIEIIKKIKEQIDKPIWIYSGYIYEILIKDPIHKKLLEEVDVLVDGPFIDSLKDLTLKFKGSSNQRIIDVNASLANNSIILLNGY
ncbi:MULTISPECIES: anaerobic ribonucleoside-triphosphate reductase activating protein [Anaerococcus]|jgi:anaerobic ribonucleoside-triphosphate reductase activating protein|uniref:Anaerobic ribonucleoside-triphosphate reductase-activating protein n=3 Tax=Anaerococcus TaxID=165779 RepID=A0A2I1MAB4_9FIRM|nr:MULTISPECIES: anaerobic ribonucleoside-triphosphate reductase activating protein [Anaerococcus]MBS6106571.1 anaerobic ribonucleoside-triphosphate reductase activating protein [Anaerococcus sp.]MDU2599125.1 anaerobic ribonucleoside-triphosphate reductase activating protein [Anaerococcus sp.]MDU3177276.1 anaerobic ribonucleoside-triphosphate reductase activating protein [Anaerococcus sp.]MDU5534891.1 anaerobic ribonucleoside-triphosphate reductase activating protein [Anaerococcus sp.]MDU74110